MSKVLVTGANGQLGKCLKDASKLYGEHTFVFADREILDITDKASIQRVFGENTFQYCINTAAYTNVEKAESEEDKAFLVNAEGARNLAEVCSEKGVTLLQVSTDYVFDGTKRTPYLETDETNPINVYGASKLKGELWIRELCTRHFIIRTSWLYSQYGHNFYNSMLRFANEGRDLSITTEQLGTPTNANDLAEALLNIVASNSEAYGIYHYSNEGSGTWYDFAKAIFEYTGKLDAVNLEKTDHYRTFAARPDYSVLGKKKYKSTFGKEPEDWKNSLEKLIANINS